MRKVHNLFIKFTTRIFFGVGIFLMIVATWLFLYDHQGFGIKIIIFTFWINLFGLFFYLLETYEKD